jgi:HSP20 family protein
MALVRWEPGREVDSLQSEVNRVFDAFFGGNNASAARARRWVPAMDLVETEDHLILRADLPGMKREEVDIEVKDGALAISGERKAEHEENTEGYYRVERASGRFARSLTLPDGIEPDAIEASFDDGVLEVRIPKPAERKPHRVEIRGAGAHANGNGHAPEAIEA